MPSYFADDGTLQSLPPEIRSLPIAQRIDLVARIWDSIGEDGEFQLTQAQTAELDRRLAERDRFPDRASNWADVKAKLLDGS